MKANFLKRASSATMVAALLCWLSGSAVAATSVTIKVNPKPTLTVTTPTPAAQCPNGPTYADYTFDIPTLAGVSAAAVNSGTPHIEYAKDRAFTQAVSTPGAYVLGAGITDSVFVRAYQDTYTTCLTTVQKIVLSVKEFPNYSITGTFAVCGASSYTYGVGGGTPDSYSWSLKNGNGAFIGGTTAATAEVTWNDVASSTVDTLILTYTKDGCTFVKKMEVNITARPSFTKANAFVCDGGTVTLASQITGQTNVGTLAFSLSRDMSAPITTLTPASSATEDITKVYVTATSSTGGCTKLDSFMVVKYAKISVELTTTASAEECATTGGTTTQAITFNVKAAGGCTANEAYSVVWTLTGADVSGVTSTGTVTFTKATDTTNGKDFTVTIPVDGTDYTVNVTSVTESGSSACGCSQTF